MDVLAWIELAGKCTLDFLYLEDIKHQKTVINKILDNSGNLVEGDSVLDILQAFYADLYRCHDLVGQDEIEQFLSGIEDLPKISHGEAMKMIGDITEQEVLSAIGKLKSG